MNNVKTSHLIHILINIISFVLLIISCIFIIIQAINNYKYNNYNNKIILAEKLVYQQFSHDVYSNIKNKILYQFEIVPYDKDCPYDKEVLKIPIKIDSFYDCENSENDELDELDEDMCQNKISSSFICCQKDCCENNVYINQKTCRTKNISNIDEEEQNDIRNNFCKYFNVYNGKFSQIFNSKICVKRYNFDYDYLLYTNENNTCNFENCTYIDTKNHCICDEVLKNNENIILNRNIYHLNKDYSIVKNIFSELNPNYFEYEMILEESILKNKKKITKKEQKKADKYKVINMNNIYDAFFKEKKIDNRDGNIHYINQTKILLGDMIRQNEEYIFKNVLNNEYMMSKSINWYTRSYIGFKNYEELQKFKKFFDEDDPTNNPLYKITEKFLCPNWVSLHLLSIFLLIPIFLAIFQIYYFIKEKNIKIYQFYISDSIRQISTLILIIIYLFIYLFKYVYAFKKINIEMEYYYQIVLEKYNMRRAQKNLLRGVILLCINSIIELTNYLFMIVIDINIGINPTSKYTIICTLRNSFNNEEFKFKFYLNKQFSEEMKRFKKKFFENYDFEECKLINEINEKKTIENDMLVRDTGLKNESIIEVICEEK